MQFYQAFTTTAVFQTLSTPAAMIARCVTFEHTLAAAQAQCGFIAAEHAAAIQKVDASGLDISAILAQSREAGSIAIPFVKHFTAAVAAHDAAAAKFVHLGATSQDVLDTAQVLFARDVLTHIHQHCATTIAALIKLSEAHSGTPVLARTLMQPAVITSFGLKTIRWAASLQYAQTQLATIQTHALALQLGGAAGNLASLGEHGDAIAQAMSTQLGLANPGYCWHTDRSRWAQLASQLAVLTGVCGKIAKDVSLMMQYEVGELAEPTAAGRGGSSAMPHKRNPVFCLQALTAAAQAPMLAATVLSAMVSEHERALGAWQSELGAFADLLGAAESATDAVAQLCAGLVVNPTAMRRNTDALLGLPNAEFATVTLSTALGKTTAHELLQRCCATAVQNQTQLLDVLLVQPEVATLSADVLAKLHNGFTTAAQLTQPAQRCRKEIQGLQGNMTNGQ